LTELLTIKEFDDNGLANSPVLLTALAEQLPAPRQLVLEVVLAKVAEAGGPFCVADLLSSHDPVVPMRQH
jgi:hypothetical protein